MYRIAYSCHIAWDREARKRVYLVYTLYVNGITCTYDVYTWNPSYRQRIYKAIEAWNSKYLYIHCMYLYIHCIYMIIYMCCCIYTFILVFYMCQSCSYLVCTDPKIFIHGIYRSKRVCTDFSQNQKNCINPGFERMTLCILTRCHNHLATSVPVM